MYWLLWLIIAPITVLLYPTRVIGKRYLKVIKKEGTILSCNHQSNIDPIYIKARIKPTSKMMAKKELFGNWFTRGLMTILGAYPVNREGNDISAIKKTLGYLKDDKTITIFPEGTRAKTEEMSELKNGLVMFALRTDSYVVPIVFKKKPRIFRLNTMLIGKPFKYDDLEEFKGVKISKDVLDRASAVLTEKMQFLKVVNVKDYKKILKEEKKKAN